MKGQIGLLLVAIAASLVIGGTLLDVFGFSSNEVSIIAKEKQVLIGIDKLEAIKQGIPYMLNYSFNQSVNEIAKTGGCQKLEECLDKLEERTKDIVNEYSSDVEELPRYSYINISLFYHGNELYKAELVANSSGLLSYKGKDFVVYDNPNVTQEIDLSFFKSLT